MFRPRARAAATMAAEASAAGEDGSGGGELLGEGSVAAADVEDMFAGLGGEEIDYCGG